MKTLLADESLIWPNLKAPNHSSQIWESFLSWLDGPIKINFAFLVVDYNVIKMNCQHSIRLAPKPTCSQFWSPKLLVKKLKLFLLKTGRFLLLRMRTSVKKEKQGKTQQKENFKKMTLSLYFIWFASSLGQSEKKDCWHLRPFDSSIGLFNSIQLIRVREKVSARGSQRFRPTPNNYIRAAWKKRIKRLRANWNNLKVDEKRKEKENHLYALI